MQPIKVNKMREVPHEVYIQIEQLMLQNAVAIN